MEVLETVRNWLKWCEESLGLKSEDFNDAAAGIKSLDQEVRKKCIFQMPILQKLGREMGTLGCFLTLLIQYSSKLCTVFQIQVKLGFNRNPSSKFNKTTINKTSVIKISRVYSFHGFVSPTSLQRQHHKCSNCAASAGSELDVCAAWVGSWKRCRKMGRLLDNCTPQLRGWFVIIPRFIDYWCVIFRGEIIWNFYRWKLIYYGLWSIN